MNQYIKSISFRAEFGFVILIAFGYFVLGSVLSVFYPSPDAPISEGSLHTLIVYESVVILILGKFLSMRGWTFQQLGLGPKVMDIAIGVGLALIAYLAYVVSWMIGSSFLIGLDQQAGHLVTANLELMTVLVVSVLNPIFEEVFVCGYVITALKKTRGISYAVNVSLGIRLAYHLYQGTVGIISIIPLGLIFSYYFAKNGRLWPVVIAHAIFDFIALIIYVQG